MWNPGDPPHPSTLAGADLDTTGHAGLRSTFNLAWPFGFDGNTSHDSASRTMFVGVDLYAPGGVTPPHVHADREKVFIVLDGDARFTVGEETRVLTPGGFAFIPVNVPHGFENAGAGDLRVAQIIAWLEAPRP
jgi:mannose-6-phosphate isomerase-like protein (cupin superfamily)